MTDLHGWITHQVDLVERLVEENEWLPSQRDGVRLRCEADRRVLARHRIDPVAASTPHAAACDGCGYDWVQDELDPVTVNLNDCPELLDLAHAHGLTDEILTGLDRPETPPPPVFKPRGLMPDTRRVPPALRGPNWSSR